MLKHYPLIIFILILKVVNSQFKLYQLLSLIVQFQFDFKIFASFHGVGIFTTIYQGLPSYHDLTFYFLRAKLTYSSHDFMKVLLITFHDFQFYQQVQPFLQFYFPFNFLFLYYLLSPLQTFIFIANFKLIWEPSLFELLPLLMFDPITLILAFG